LQGKNVKNDNVSKNSWRVKEICTSPQQTFANTTKKMLWDTPEPYGSANVVKREPKLVLSLTELGIFRKYRIY